MNYQNLGKRASWFGRKNGRRSMLTRIILMLLLSSCAAAAKSAEDAASDPATQLSVNLVGVGNKTCSDWLSSPSRKLEGAGWIYGFWGGAYIFVWGGWQKQTPAA